MQGTDVATRGRTAICPGEEITIETAQELVPYSIYPEGPGKREYVRPVPEHLIVSELDGCGFDVSTEIRKMTAKGILHRTEKKVGAACSFGRFANEIESRWKLPDGRVAVEVLSAQRGVGAGVRVAIHDDGDVHWAVWDKGIEFTGVSCYTVADEWVAFAESGGERAGAKRAGRSAGAKRPKRKRTTRLTPRENEILKTISECGGDGGEAARQLNISRQRVNAVVQKSKRVYRQANSRATRSVHADQMLPTDESGQSVVTTGRGKSDRGSGRKTRMRSRR